MFENIFVGFIYCAKNIFIARHEGGVLRVRKKIIRQKFIFNQTRVNTSFPPQNLLSCCLLEMQINMLFYVLKIRKLYSAKIKLSFVSSLDKKLTIFILVFRLVFDLFFFVLITFFRLKIFCLSISFNKRKKSLYF